MMQAQSANHPLTSGSDVGYKHATVNQHRLGVGEPLRVKQGREVLMHLLNASATENVVLALPGHTFRIIAMDGNPVLNPKEIEVVSLAAAQRVYAIVEMKSPGVWVLAQHWRRVARWDFALWWSTQARLVRQYGRIRGMRSGTIPSSPTAHLRPRPIGFMQLIRYTT